MSSTHQKQGSLTALNQAVTIEGTHESIAVQITGTFVGTVTFEASLDNGTTYAPVGLRAVADVAGAAVTAPTAPGMWTTTYSAAGFPLFRARCSAFTSGAIVVTVCAAD